MSGRSPPIRQTPRCGGFLALAVASLGEEGRLHFERAKRIVEATFPEGDAVATEQYALGMARAAALYAEQAARGSAGAIQSLRIVANHLTDDAARVKATVGDPLIQRLLAVYVLARVSQEHQQAASSGSDEPSIAIVLARAIKERKLQSPYGGDRLAALAYKTGHYELAQQLADTASGPLAAWVKAKIAVQKNELVSAAAHYSEAARSFPGYDHIIDSERARLVFGETAVLSLARGQYVEALDLLLPHADTYWGDIVHIAERVLTTNELKAFADRKIGRASYAGIEHDDGLSRKAALLNLLARRLVREGRFEEAAAYFQGEEIKATASQYGQLLARTDDKRSDLAKARLLYMAAIIARRAGMQIMGYEGSPDYAVEEGNYNAGAGQVELGAAFVTTEERSRFEGSKATPNLRFHYRYLAIGHAEKAAGMLPPRSQAFAAILCQAASWVIDRPDGLEKAQELYRRYIREGAYVGFGATFGRQCPNPNFKSATDLAHSQWYKRYVPFSTTFERVASYLRRMRLGGPRA